MSASETALPLRVGARTVLTLRRRLARRRLSLEEALAPVPPTLAPLDDRADGYLLTALPACFVQAIAKQQPMLRTFVRQGYRRHYAALDGGFDAYLAGFSSKTRSSLTRKAKKLAREGGGALDIRCFPGDLDVAAFHSFARAVSATSYQERLLDAGLPDGEQALAEMRALAARDALRGWLLFLEERPIAYLYAPAEGDTLIYAYLGYAPAFAALSPGTVLQLEAMRRLMEEGRFRFFDFTEGEGRHKSQFATGHVDSVDLLLVRPSLANFCAFHSFGLFDRCVSLAKSVLIASGAERALKRMRR